MPAPVRIEKDAWDDPRYTLLAGYCGYARPRFALVQCAWVWSYCTEKGSDVHDAAIIDAHVQEPGFAAKMVKAKLAEKVAGGVRIKGTAGRIEWLQQRRASAALGGKAKATNRLARASEVVEQTPAKRLPEPKQEPSNILPSVSLSSSVSLSRSEGSTHPSLAEASSVREASAASSDPVEEDRAAAVRGRKLLWDVFQRDDWHHQGKWAAPLATIARKPAAEWLVVGATLAAAVAAGTPRRILTPTHIVDYWATYADGKTPGARDATPPPAAASPVLVKLRSDLAAVIAEERTILDATEPEDDAGARLYDLNKQRGDLEMRISRAEARP